MKEEAKDQDTRIAIKSPSENGKGGLDKSVPAEISKLLTPLRQGNRMTKSSRSQEVGMEISRRESSTGRLG